MSEFSISYLEYRADNGVSWNVNYDLSFDGASFLVETLVNLTGDEPDTATVQTWEQGIEGIWNNQFALSDGWNTYPVAFDIQFVDSGAHYDVAVHNSLGHADMLNWYTISDWGQSYMDEIAAHEFGHMIGMFDEYSGGGTYSGYTTTGTLMSDLTPTLSPGYLFSVDYYAESLADSTFTIVPAGIGSPVPALVA